jgi:hypothetical protein
MAVSRFDLTQPPGPLMSAVGCATTRLSRRVTASDTTQDIKGQTR